MGAAPSCSDSTHSCWFAYSTLPEDPSGFMLKYSHHSVFVLHLCVLAPVPMCACLFGPAACVPLCCQCVGLSLHVFVPMQCLSKPENLQAVASDGTLDLCNRQRFSSRLIICR